MKMGGLKRPKIVCTYYALRIRKHTFMKIPFISGGVRGKGKQAVVKANNKQGPNSFKGVANNNRGKNVARGGGRGGTVIIILSLI